MKTPEIILDETLPSEINLSKIKEDEIVKAMKVFGKQEYNQAVIDCYKIAEDISILKLLKV